MQVNTNFLIKSNTFKTLFFIWIIFTMFVFLTPVSFRESLFKNSDKIYHIISSFITASLFYLSFKGKKWALLGSILFTIFYGLIIEILQFFLPCRDFSTLDLISDGLGAGIFLCFSLLFKQKS